jgi:hypothetical protein
MPAHLKICVALVGLAAVACGGSVPSSIVADAGVARADAIADGGPPADAIPFCVTGDCPPGDFCYRLFAGKPGPRQAAAPDAGFMGSGCYPIPSSCASAPTCDCVEADVTSCFGPSLQCETLDGGIRVTCSLP